MKAKVYLSQKTRMFAVVIGGFAYGAFDYYSDERIGSIVLSILAGEYDFIKAPAGSAYDDEEVYCSYDLTIRLEPRQ